MSVLCLAERTARPPLFNVYTNSALSINPIKNKRHSQPSCCCSLSAIHGRSIQASQGRHCNPVASSHNSSLLSLRISATCNLPVGSSLGAGDRHRRSISTSEGNSRKSKKNLSMLSIHTTGPISLQTQPPDSAAGSSGHHNSKGKQMRVAIVGGGVGGLAVAARLAKEGMHVTLFEKNDELGGRLQSLYLGENNEFRFDTGPSLMLMPEKYREAFKEMGESLDNYVQIRRVEPVAYRVFFPGTDGAEPAVPDGVELSQQSTGGCHLDLLYDVQRMCAQLEEVEAGAGAAYLRFLANAKEALDKGTKNFIERDFRTLADYLDIPRLLPLLAHLSPLELLGQHCARMATYFRDPRLRALFTFQDLYVGLSPYNAPGVFSLLAATEITDGVWYPVGGFGKIRDALAEVAAKRGATMHTRTPVISIRIDGGKVRGVILEDGSLVEADIVVANADLPYVYSDLIEGDRPKVKARQLAELDYSAGIISFSWCLDTRLDSLAHHNVFLSDEFEASWQRARDPASLLARPNFYVHAPQRTDPTTAPPGCDAITILMPVGNLAEVKGGDYSALVGAARVAVSRRFAEAGVCEDVTAHIVDRVSQHAAGAPNCVDPRSRRSQSSEGAASSESHEDMHAKEERMHSATATILAPSKGASYNGDGLKEGRRGGSGELAIAPPDWKVMYNLKHGAAFGLSHGLSQLAYFRPDVADAEVEGLYFVGASTRPGNGVPLVLIGANTTTNRILEDYDRMR